jgi:glycosyltransferase involved in cell wall biosynthesis
MRVKNTMSFADLLNNRFRSRRTPYVLFLAVLPAYRKECIEIVKVQLGEKIELFVSAAHLDSSVKTGIPASMYRSVRMIRLARKKLFIQVVPSVLPITAEALVVDLNPRSLSAWALLIARRILGRRTLVWGHIHGQAGADSRTAALRLTMRRLATGTITYTYMDSSKAKKDIPRSQVWVAPNALYKAKDIVAAGHTKSDDRREILYVGRFVIPKKVDLLIRGFAIAAASNTELRLRLIGGGTEEPRLRALATSLGVEDRVVFAGWEDSVVRLREAYSTAFCSVSTGFAGLGLTQSLGFGVPMVVADGEPHSPEIELANFGGVYWFTADAPESLAEALLERWEYRHTIPLNAISQSTCERYSAEAMAAGLVDALTNKRSVDVADREESS